MSIGERIQMARKNAKLSQKDLGDRLGVSASMIGQYENNLRKPKFETLVKIADALDVNPSELDRSLVINLGSDVLVETENGEYITASMDTREGKMLSRFQALNELGKDEAIRYADMLLDINKYRKKPLEEPLQAE